MVADEDLDSVSIRFVAAQWVVESAEWLDHVSLVDFLVVAVHEVARNEMFFFQN